VSKPPTGEWRPFVRTGGGGGSTFKKRFRKIENGSNIIRLRVGDYQHKIRDKRERCVKRMYLLFL
jgi:hypothetical protein